MFAAVRRARAAKVLDRDHAADADASDPRAADRVALVAIFGTMGGICAMVALFVVAGTFSLAIVQRRNEIAVLRALGAAPHQVRRLIAGEALIVSVVAGALGLLAGGPLADAIVDVMADHGAVPPGFAPGHRWIPLVAAFGGGILIAQLAVFAAARRAGRTRPAEALREAAIERARPGVLQLGAGVLLPRRRRRDGAASSRARGRSRSRSSRGCCWRPASACSAARCSGLPAALLAWPLRRLGASGLLASTEPRRQPLADRRAGHAGRARRDARGHAGHRPDQRAARRRERHRRARDRAVRAHRPRRRADPRGHGRRGSTTYAVAALDATSTPRRPPTPRTPRGRRRASSPRARRRSTSASPRATCRPFAATPSRSATCSPRPAT